MRMILTATLATAFAALAAPAAPAQRYDPDEEFAPSRRPGADDPDRYDYALEDEAAAPGDSEAQEEEEEFSRKPPDRRFGFRAGRGEAAGRDGERADHGRGPDRFRGWGVLWGYRHGRHHRHCRDGESGERGWAGHHHGRHGWYGRHGHRGRHGDRGSRGQHGRHGEGGWRGEHHGWWDSERERPGRHPGLERSGWDRRRGGEHPPGPGPSRIADIDRKLDRVLRELEELRRQLRR